MLLIPNNIHQKIFTKKTVCMRIAKYLLFSSFHHINMPENWQSSPKNDDFILKSAFLSFNFIHKYKNKPRQHLYKIKVMSMPLLKVLRVSRSTMHSVTYPWKCLTGSLQTDG